LIVILLIKDSIFSSKVLLILFNLELIYILIYRSKRFRPTSQACLSQGSLTKTFLQLYQGTLVIFEAWRKCYLNFFGYKFIIHQSSYLGK
jgi:hypothetical protein